MQRVHAAVASCASSDLWRVLAEAVVAIHLGFILFAVAGSLLALKNRRWAYWHLPTVAWVAYIELTHSICPLTPLENTLRHKALETGYSGGFIAHYITPIIYPAGLTPAIQTMLGIAFVAGNAIVYFIVWRRSRTPRETVLH